MTNYVIEVEGVSKSFGGVVANTGISLKVPDGKITGLIGPNGSGKRHCSIPLSAITRLMKGRSSSRGRKFPGIVYRRSLVWDFSAPSSKRAFTRT